MTTPWPGWRSSTAGVRRNTLGRDFVLLSPLSLNSVLSHNSSSQAQLLRNLTATVTEENLRETFERLHCITYVTYPDGFWKRWNCSICRFGRVERVKKIKDYAFVHFEERIQAVEGEKRTWYESVFNPLGLWKVKNEYDVTVYSTLWVWAAAESSKILLFPLLFLSNHAQDHLWWVSESSHIQLCCELHWRAPRSPTYILNIQKTFSTDKHFLNQHTT